MIATEDGGVMSFVGKGLEETCGIMVVSVINEIYILQNMDYKSIEYIQVC